MSKGVPIWLNEKGYEERPWGSFEVLLESDKYKVKRIIVKPGKRLSYQSHEWRSETWVIVQGEARVTLDDVDITFLQDQVVKIPAKTKHRVANNKGKRNLIFIEIQTGTYFGEDDIVRYEDDFGREGTTE